MDHVLKSDDVRPFVDRRWDLVKREKLRFLADCYKQGGPAAARAAARKLYHRWRALYPETVCSKTRANDLENHVALKRQLEQAGNAIRGC